MRKMLSFSSSLFGRNRYGFGNEVNNSFGFIDVKTEEKQPLVNKVFHSVASKYDIMNDVMSAGVHRYWKTQLISEMGVLTPKVYTHEPTPKVRVLDVAGGTGDIAFRILQNNDPAKIKLTVLDINSSMLEEGRKRAQQMGLTSQNIQFVCANAEELPFTKGSFDVYTISFGLRNVPRTRKAVEQAKRVLKFGGRFMCLQFSKVQNEILKQIYKFYSFNVIPEMGKLVASDKQSYQYLVESIQRFLTQEQLLRMMEECGLQNTNYINYTDGVVALHSGYKLD